MKAIVEAAAYLRSLGFTSARRGAQHKGGSDSPDVLADELPGVHIEVKHRAGIDLGTVELDRAVTQANSDAGPDREPVVLWRRNRIGWRLTWIERGVQLTTCGDAEIAATLRRLNAGAVGYLYDPHVADAIQRQRRIDSEACSIPITPRTEHPIIWRLGGPSKLIPSQTPPADPRPDNAPEGLRRRAGRSRLAAIRLRCLDCTGTAAEVKKCIATDCDLWPYRLGHNPKLAGRKTNLAGLQAARSKRPVRLAVSARQIASSTKAESDPHPEADAAERRG